MPSYGGNGGPGGLGWQGWENASGQSIGPGGVWDETTFYNQNSRNIPEGALTFDPNARQDPPTRGPNGEILHKNPNWTQGGSEYYFLNEDGTPAGSTGFNGSNVSNAPWNNQSPAPRQGGGGGGWGAVDPSRGGGSPMQYGGSSYGGQMMGGNYQGGGWGGQTDPYQGGNTWGGARPTMAGRMLGSMYGQRR